MHPSIADERRSQGLCGTVGKDKLLDPNNVDLTSDPKSFALSWKYVISRHVSFQIY